MGKIKNLERWKKLRVGGMVIDVRYMGIGKIMEWEGGVLKGWDILWVHCKKNISKIFIYPGQACGA